MDPLEVAGLRLGRTLGVAVATEPVTGASRRAERQAGMVAVRSAFVAAGARRDLGVVRHEQDGRPCWPTGWTGSIAHTATHAVATVSAVGVHDAVGIDIEERRGLSLDDAALVLDADEHDAASRSTDPSDTATLLWSAKEAAFKAWSTASGGLQGIDPVDIRIALGDGMFGAEAVDALADHARSLGPLTGRYELTEDTVMTLVVRR